jgi:hypothetical protein
VIVKDGKNWYREWSTVIDSYVTVPTPNLEAFKKFLYEDELKQFKEEFESLFLKRIERATRLGTSSYFSTGRSLEEWDKSMLEADGEFDLEERSNGRPTQ